MSKGIAMEELPATMFVIIMLFLFFFSILGSYDMFFSGVGMIEHERTSSAIVYKIYEYNNGTISNLIDSLAPIRNINNINVTVTKFDKVESTFTELNNIDFEPRSVSVSSLAVLIYENGKYYPGRIDVSVGE